MNAFKINILLGLVFFMVVMGCNDAVSENDLEQKSPIAAMQQNDLVINDTTNSGSRDTLILLKNDHAIIRGHLSLEHPKIKYTIPVWKGQTIVATLKPVTKEGNIEIFQIQKPGGMLAGPYRDSLKYTADKHGNIKLIISENLLLKQPYIGDFILHVSVK